MSELDKWVLGTVKDIDEQICAYAEEHINLSSAKKGDNQFFAAQKVRVELIKAIMGD